MDKISIVIPTYNSSKHLGTHLEVLRDLSSKHMLDVEIIVVDTGSGDRTVDIAERCADKVITTPRGTRGAARNAGAKLAKSQTLAFIDSDCEITEKWILHVCDLSGDLNSKVLGGPTILDIPHSTTGKAIRALLSDPLFTLNSSSFSILERHKNVKELPAANMLIAKDFFEKIEGFPDLQFNEDTLFCRKVLEKNGKIVYNSELQVIHKHYFSGIKSFARYFFKYGEKFAITFKTHPFLVRRYALVAFISLVALMFAFLMMLVNLPLSLFFFTVISLLFFVGILLYSVAKFREKHVVLIPMLFIVLVLSYISGFHYGFLKPR